MRFTALLLLVGSLHVAASGHSQRISLDMKDAPVQKVFREVIRQSSVSIIYDVRLFENAKPVTIKIQDASVEEVIEKCLQGTGLEYSVEGNSVIIKRKPASINFSPVDNNIPPPPIDVRGRVTNVDGEPAPGVTVTVKGTTNATATDAAGEFLLKGVAENATLVFTSANMETHEVRISGRTEVAVSLKTKVSSLDDLKIIAYGTTTERLRTGAVSTVKAEVIERQPVGDVLLALQGQVPGLDIVQGTALPGARVQFNIRGLNSLNPLAAGGGSNDPLVVIDGVPFSAEAITLGSTFQYPNNAYAPDGGLSALAAINPADIERVDVLKDADATAIYGSRGANGVILITTKRAKQGKPSLNVDISHGIGKLTRRLDLLNTRQYLDMRYEAFANDGIDWRTLTNKPVDLASWDTTRYADWQKELLGGAAKFTKANVSYAGGTQQNSFRIATNYRSEGSIFGNEFTSQTFSGQMTFNHRSANNRMGFDVNAGYTYNDILQPNGNLYRVALSLAPNAPKLYNDDGSLNWENNTFNNPLVELDRTQEIKSQNLNTGWTFFYKVTKNLTLKADAGFGRVDFDMVNLTPASSFNPSFSISPTSRSGRYGRNITYNSSIEPQAEYRTKLGPGKLDALVGFALQRRTNETHQTFANGFLSDDMMRNYATATNITNVPTQTLDYRYSAVFARLGYNIQNRYILSLNARRDGSSRFGQGKQFGNFGSAGLAWIFSEEAAIKKAMPAFISFGKLRLSYGTTGSDAIGDYQYLSLFSIRRPLGTFDPPYTVLQPDRLFNPDFAWETNRKADVELSLGFLNDRITTTVNYYNNRSGNQLIGLPLPRMTGFASVNGNLRATVENSGVEVQLNAEIIKSQNFSWSSNFNFTRPRNKLIEYPNLETSPHVRSFVVGQPISIRRTYDHVGVNPQTGVNVYRTADGKDTSILSGLGLGFFNQTVIIDLTPKYYGGWTNNFRYKGWNLSFSMRYDYRTRSDGFTGFPGFEGNIPQYVFNNSWRKPGDVALYQKFTQRTSSPAYYSRAHSITDAYYSDVWYLSLQNLSLSYALPGPLLKKLRLSSCRLYLNGQNLFTVTNFNGADPAALGATSMPRLQILTAGVNLNL